MSAGPLGTVAGGADLLRDVREQLRDSQEAQRRAAETQAAILNALPAHVALIDATGGILAVNDAWRCAATANALQGPDCGVGQNYIELCRRIRAATLRSPVYVILLTARSSRQDLVVGLEAGADDYLTKPFDPDELRARIHVGQRTLGLMANIKRLTGLLPICSYCKRIRSDHDYWEQVESYITEHTDALFSHGICPSCLAKAMEELDPPAINSPKSGA